MPPWAILFLGRDRTKDLPITYKDLKIHTATTHVITNILVCILRSLF
jgi:hypothetical protein